MTEIEKLQILLSHWIEHNNGHQREIEKWIAVLERHEKTDTLPHIKQAIAHLLAADKALAQALETIGGAKHGHDHHHHQ